MQEVLKAVEDGITGLRDEFRRELDEIAQKMETAGDGSVRGTGADPLARLTNDAGIKALAEGKAKSAFVKLDGGLDLLTKSTVVGDTAGTSEEGYSVQPQRDPRLANDPRRALSLLDFLPRIRVTSNTFEYNALDSYINAANYQTTEGAIKPEGALPTALKSANIATIAHWLPASEQVLADAPALRQQIVSLLQYGIRSKLEREIIVGAGGAGQIAGLTNAGNFTAYVAASNDTLADAVAKAQATMDAAGWRAGLVIVHPGDWRIAMTERATGGEYVAGSWRNPAPPSIWGVPVVTHPAVTAGDMIVMDPSQVAVLDRMQATVEVGRIDKQFVQNVVTLRAELRAGLAVFAPGSVMFGDYGL